ncbi:MAG TPA: hypothetical protein VFI25_11110 [Planctomycetota bacterium]|jgi:hypothetical protein|nr:hypothetical protein [Planctomycetota bacterium]
MRTSDTGHAGEHLVMAELLRRGYAAALTRDGSLGIDILAASPDGARTVAIQVKTKKRSRRWRLRAKDERRTAVVYVLVDLVGERPRFYVVPGAVVAENIARKHRQWLAAPGRGGRPHKDSEIRQFGFEDPPDAAVGPAEQFLDRWEKLGL